MEQAWAEYEPTTHEVSVKPISINTSLQPSVAYVGNEKTPVITIDNFLANNPDVREFAVNIPNYQADGLTAYPGVRSELPEAYIHPSLAALLPLVSEVYGVPAGLTPSCKMAYFSLLTRQESELEVAQRLPHFDTDYQHYYAILHYLNPGDYGGTGFFRHRPTGFERITTDNRDLYFQSASAFMAVRGLPEARYMASSDNHFELYSQVPYKQNRVVIYPGSLLHSGLIKPETDISDDPELGRLTANMFVQFG